MSIKRQDAGLILMQRFEKEIREGKIRLTANPRTGVIEVEKWEVPGVERPETDEDFDKWIVPERADDKRLDLALKRLLSIDLSRREIGKQDIEDAVRLFIRELQRKHGV